MIGLGRTSRHASAATRLSAALGTAAIVAVASAGASVGIVVLASGTAAAAEPTCTDNWTGPASGTQAWSTASNWSAGIPGSTSVVCIAKAGTYTVDLPSSANVSAVELGASSGIQTLKVDGVSTSVALNVAAASFVNANGALLLAPAAGYADINGIGGWTIASGGSLTSSASSGAQPAYIETGLINQSGGSVTLDAPSTRQDESTVTTTSGTFTVGTIGAYTVTGSFTHAGGTLTVNGSMSQSSGTFTQTSGGLAGTPVQLSNVTISDAGGGGTLDVIGSSTLIGTIPTGQTVIVDGTSTSVALSIPQPVSNLGTLSLKSTTSGYTDIQGTGGVIVGSGGSITTSGPAGSQPSYLYTPITNQAGTVTISGPNTLIGNSAAIVNSSTFTVTATGALSTNGQMSFTQAAGTLTVSGAMSQSGYYFIQSGGTESGNPVVLTGGVVLLDSAGTGAFDVRGSSTLYGTIPAGQTVTVDGTSTSVALSLPSPVTDAGTLALAPTANGYADINEGGGVTVASGGKLTTAAAAGSQSAYFETPISNQSGGTVSVGAPTTRWDQNYPITNSGTFTVTATGDLLGSGGGWFTQAAGTLSVAGAVTLTNATFAESGGAESGNPVTMSNVTLLDSAGTGGFDVTGSSTLIGTVPAGQTVTVDGGTTSVQLAMPTPITDKGTIALKPGTSGYADITGGGGVTVASGGTLSTTGGTTSQPAYFQTPITIQIGGTVSIGAATTDQNETTATVNHGTFKVLNGGELFLSGNATLTNSGTLSVTVNSNGTSSGISGPGLTLGGTLSVNTVGTPANGSVFTPIAGPVTGTFSALSFGPHRYTVSYPSGAVQLVTGPTYTVAIKSFSPHQNIPTGSVVVATIGSATNGTGTYSATINWGDGSATQAATVAISGSTGTVTAPTHTYTTTGTKTVTVTVTNTAGTSFTVTESVTVPVLAITSISPTGGPVAGGTKVTITGTGFTGATAVVFGTESATFSVVSDTQITATAPAQAAGTYRIAVTTPGGTSPAVAADLYTYS